MILIIDGDFIPYRVGYSMENSMDKSFECAKTKVQDLLLQLTEAAGTNETISFLGGKNNFRYDLVQHLPDELKTPQYKANRTREKPLYYKEIKQHLINDYGFHLVNGIESDDACAIALTQLGKNGILLSTDKDVLQVPGYHIQVKPNEIQHLEVVNPGQVTLSENRKKVIGSGDKLLWSQMLTGDGVDNFKGVPKCGPVKAVSLLEDAEIDKIPNIVFNEFKKAYGNHATVMYKFTFNLAYMLRYHPNLSTLPTPVKII